MRNLPNVSAFPIEKDLRNVQQSFYGKEENFKRNVDVNAKIKAIFASNNHVYKSKCKIVLKDDTVTKIIVGRTGKELLTITGEKIRISDILDIDAIREIM